MHKTYFVIFTVKIIFQIPPKSTYLCTVHMHEQSQIPGGNVLYSPRRAKTRSLKVTCTVDFVQYVHCAGQLTKISNLWVNVRFPAMYKSSMYSCSTSVWNKCKFADKDSLTTNIERSTTKSWHVVFSSLFPAIAPTLAWTGFLGVFLWRRHVVIYSSLLPVCN